MSHLSPSAKLHAKNELSLEDIVQGQLHFTLSSAVCKCWASQDSRKDFSSSTPSHWCFAFLLLPFVLQVALSDFLL